MKKIAVVLVALMVVACSSTSKTNPSQAAPANTPNATPASASETAPGKVAAEEVANQQQSIYFDFDKSIVKPEYRAVIRKEATYMKANKNDVVTVEGNCDERGSAEYNLALGQRRADAAKKQLMASGVPASRIKTTSWGKEKPKLLCHEEKCWKENRRVDFVHGQ